MRTILSRLRRHERGTSVIELAIIAPVLSLVTMGIIDLSTAYARRLQLTEAVDTAITQISARDFDIRNDADEVDFTAFKQSAAQAAGVEPEEVQVESWLECDGEPTDGDLDDDCGGRRYGQAGCEASIASPPPECFPVEAKYVRITINSAFAPMFASVIAPRADGTFPLTAEAAVRIQ